MPSELEIKNSAKVLEMLNEIEGIYFEQSQARGDIFKVTEYDTGMELTMVVDVEETSVISMIEICNIPESGLNVSLCRLLLSENNKSVHGSFGISEEGKIIVKDVLEIANLDVNELEASIANVFRLTAKNINKISEIIS